MIHDIVAAFEAVKKNDTIRAAVLTGAGKSFSAGGDVEKDLNPLRNMGVAEYREYFGRAEELYVGIIGLEKAVIAAMNEFSVGAWLDLALVCDVRIAAADAQMGEFCLRMGICPEVAPFLLPRIVGLGRAKLLCMTGDLRDAAHAEKNWFG